jgi:Cu/Zn superoxide dismutase
MKLRLLSVLIAGLFAGVAFAQSGDKMDKKSGKAKSVSVRIGAQHKSGEHGSAKLTPMGDQTKVEVSLKGAPKGVSQPMHIHEGSCAKLDPKPKYGLSNLVDGKSTTTIPVKLEDLQGGNMAINIHKSAEDVKTYVACGDIKAHKK